MEHIDTDVLIIGAGAAGLSAAVYTSRENFTTTVLQGLTGSALSLTPTIENYPGFETGSGDELLQKLTGQAEEFGAAIVLDNALSFDTTHPDYVTVMTEFGKTITARAVLIATGAEAKLLGLPGEKDHYGKGISTCATCDGFFFRDKSVVVTGGGDTAIEDTLFLANTFNTKVDLLVRGDKFKTNSPDARKLMKLASDPESNITIHFNTSVSELTYAENQLDTVITNTGDTYDVDGLFIAIGRNPSTKFLKDSTVPLTEEGYVLTSNEGRDDGVKVPGLENSRVWACGDVVDFRYSQAITASGAAVKAAIQMREFLNSKEG